MADQEEDQVVRCIQHRRHQHRRGEEDKKSPNIDQEEEGKNVSNTDTRQHNQERRQQSRQDEDVSNTMTVVCEEGENNPTWWREQSLEVSCRGGRDQG